MKNFDQKIKIGGILMAAFFLTAVGFKKTQSYFLDRETSEGNVLSVATSYEEDPPPPAPTTALTPTLEPTPTSTESASPAPTETPTPE